MSDTHLKQLEQQFRQIIQSATQDSLPTGGGVTAGGKSLGEGPIAVPELVTPDALSVVVSSKKSGGKWGLIKWVAIGGLVIVVIVVVCVCMRRSSETSSSTPNTEFKPKALPNYTNLLKKSQQLAKSAASTPSRHRQPPPPPETTRLTDPPPQNTEAEIQSTKDPNFTSLQELVAKRSGARAAPGGHPPGAARPRVAEPSARPPARVAAPSARPPTRVAATPDRPRPPGM